MIFEVYFSTYLRDEQHVIPRCYDFYALLIPVYPRLLSQGISNETERCVHSFQLLNGSRSGNPFSFFFTNIPV